MKHVIFSIFFIASIGGCHHTPPKTRQPADNMNRVEQKYQHFFLNWSADKVSPNDREISALIKFLKPYQGHESAHLYIEQSPDHTAAQEKWLITSLREYCQLSSLQIHTIPAEKSYQRPGYKIHVESYTVQLPNCDVKPWEFGKADGQSMPTLGCTSNSNLGAMIVDPRDLVQGDTGDKTTTIRAAPLAQVVSEVYANKFTPFNSKSSSNSSGSGSSTAGGSASGGSASGGNASGSSAAISSSPTIGQ